MTCWLNTAFDVGTILVNFLIFRQTVLSAWFAFWGTNLGDEKEGSTKQGTRNVNKDNETISRFRFSGETNGKEMQKRFITHVHNHCTTYYWVESHSVCNHTSGNKIVCPGRIERQENLLQIYHKNYSVRKVMKLWKTSKISIETLTKEALIV